MTNGTAELFPVGICLRDDFSDLERRAVKHSVSTLVTHYSEASVHTRETEVRHPTVVEALGAAGAKFFVDATTIRYLKLIPKYFYADVVAILRKPSGLPSWIREQDGWARRSGTNNISKRLAITIRVPNGVLA